MPWPPTSFPFSDSPSRTLATPCSCMQPHPTQPPPFPHLSLPQRLFSAPRQITPYYLALQKSQDTPRTTLQRLQIFSPLWRASMVRKMPRRSLKRNPAGRSLPRRRRTSAPSSYLADQKANAPRGPRSPSNIPSYKCNTLNKDIQYYSSCPAKTQPVMKCSNMCSTSYVEVSQQRM